MNRARQPGELFYDYQARRIVEQQRIDDYLKGKPIWSAFMGPYSRIKHGPIGIQSENERRKSV